MKRKDRFIYMKGWIAFGQKKIESVQEIGKRHFLEE